MLKNSRLLRIVLPLALVVSLAGISCAAMLRSPKEADYDSRPSRRRQASLPNTGSIAVLADSTDSQHAAIAEAAIIDELVANGYTVVDDAALARIHRQAERDKAISRAFGGNVSGIANIGRSSKASYTILARVKAGIPERNEAKLYTGTASAVIMAVSSQGDKLGGRTASGKAVGYTIDEAREKALEKAIREGLSQLF
ncbi:MAG: hypothetical protein IJR63_02535 [Synergistaceae bacterium]|nr:hypothetical protein [Synergistaceae bacterium]